MMPLATQREYGRWYDLIPHPVQEALKTDDIRFKVVPAGRRSGKTEQAKRFVASAAMINPGESYFLAAPTRDQVKKIYWEDMKKLCHTSTPLFCRKPPSETELTIFMGNGTDIQLIGLDKPSRMEGVFWSGGVIDEIADIKAEAWEANISPALDTFNPARPDYKAWCWLIGVPDGLNHYYDLYQYAVNSGDPEWKAYTWKSSDILPPETIAAAKRRMSQKQFKQEYEASFETASGRVYEDYSQVNTTDARIEPHELLLWAHDQNYTPLSSSVSVLRGNDIFILDEIVLTSAVSRQSAMEFVEKFRDHKNKTVHIYGDPAGRAGEKHGHASDYTELEDVLRSNGWKYVRKVKRDAPAIKDRQNAVRAKILNAAGETSLYVNPVSAKWCHKGLSTTQLQKGSTFQEDQKNQYQHITTAIGYMIDVLFPINGGGVYHFKR
jgi:hypothetical protein